MPGAASRRRSRTIRWAARSRLVHVPQRVGASGPNSAIESTRARRSSRAKVTRPNLPAGELLALGRWNRDDGRDDHRPATVLVRYPFTDHAPDRLGDAVRVVDALGGQAQEFRLDQLSRILEGRGVVGES